MMTYLNRQIAKHWTEEVASKTELFEVMDEAMLTPLQRSIIIMKRKNDKTIAGISLSVDFSDSKINKEIAKARDKIYRVLKLRHI